MIFFIGIKKHDFFIGIEKHDCLYVINIKEKRLVTNDTSLCRCCWGDPPHPADLQSQVPGLSSDRLCRHPLQGAGPPGTGALHRTPRPGPPHRPPQGCEGPQCAPMKEATGGGQEEVLLLSH